MRRFAVMLVLATSAGCVKRVLVNPAALEKVKTVAVVQFAENWGEHKFHFGGFDTEKHRLPLIQTYDAFIEQLGTRWKVMNRIQLQNHPEYIRLAVELPPGHPYMPRGFRALPGPGREVSWARLSLENAAKVAKALEVDAVIALSVSWAIDDTDRGGHVSNTYYVNMYDRDGVRIWGDEVVGVSQLDDFMPLESITQLGNFRYKHHGQVDEKWPQQNVSAVADAVGKMKQHLEHPLPEYLPPKN